MSEWLKKLLLSNESFKKVITGAFIAGAGALLTYVSQAMTGLDFGVVTPVVVASLSVMVNYLKKLVEQLKTPEEPQV